jgi:hypothetical protein
VYNFGSTDTAYSGTGEELDDWKLMDVAAVSGTPDTIVFTGGGINEFLPTPTCAYGRREATIRPALGTRIIPQTYVESETDNLMYNVPLAGKNTNRYVFGVYVDGYTASDIFCEAWDNNNFSSTVLTTLSGTPLYPYSMLNAISTTSGSPPVGWTGATYSGTGMSAYLAGYDYRVRLKGQDEVQNECLYYNIYVSLPFDSEYFHNRPVLSFRYLYI